MNRTGVQSSRCGSQQKLVVQLREMALVLASIRIGLVKRPLF
jgi:hypothetical protein